MSELPSISNCSLMNSTYLPDLTSGFSTGIIGLGSSSQYTREVYKYPTLDDEHTKAMMGLEEKAMKLKKRPAKETMAESKQRIVRVFIVDPDFRIPLNKAILFEAPEQLTDLTDQELFMEVNIKPILVEHNAYRTGLVDKTVKSEKQVFLEPVRIRDLKMVVSTIAEF